ncbi:HAD subfamily IIID h [Paraphysoderma sedebokerense]|nr:HAD subfamily IIID h [Paraphysoderma sedebokerense]
MSTESDSLSASHQVHHPVDNETSDDVAPIQTITLTAKWNSQLFPFEIPVECSIGELKTQLAVLTSVPVDRQKLVGLFKGKLPPNDTIISSLNLKPDQSFLLIGTPSHDTFKDPKDVDGLVEVLNDLDGVDMDYKGEEMKTVENQKKLKRYIEKTSINIINPPRPGKKLLVMDLDYTIFDCKSTAERMSELLRPGTHEFLTAAYQYYDIVVWSQTSWRALEMKITELGILTHPGYKIAFVLDKTSMFSITTKRNGKPYKHEVKALDIIWNKFPELYSPVNSIHIDDLSRNFAMNPQSGLKITAFKNAPQTRQFDREMFPLAKYLLQISLVEDFRVLDHKRWKKFEGKLPPDFNPDSLPDSSSSSSSSS